MTNRQNRSWSAASSHQSRRVFHLARTALAGLAVAAGLAAIPLPAPAAAVAAQAVDLAQPRPEVDVDKLAMVPDNTWGVSGLDPTQTQTESLDVLVWDMVQLGDRMFVGGGFLNVQENGDADPIKQSFVAAFDVNTGDWISSWKPTLDRVVYALEVYDGKLIVGGEFETVNGEPRKGLVALDPATGAIDRSFEGSVDRPWSEKRAVVRDLQTVGQHLYLAGNFSHLLGANNARSQAFKAGRFASSAGAPDRSWNPRVTGSGVWGIDVNPERGEVYLAGYFTAVNGESNTGNFHTIDTGTGATVGGKIELPRNYANIQPEFFDTASSEKLVFAIGEQHVIQVLRADDQKMLGFHHTGSKTDGFAYDRAFAGGAYQVGERIGDILFAGCHCTFSERDGWVNHYSSFSKKRTPHRLLMAYNANTGRLIDGFLPDIHSPQDGTWAVASDTNGCLWIGGDFHVGGVDHEQSRWLGGFARLCEGTDSPPEAGDRALIPAGATWRYDDSGADLDTDWKETSYNDAAWKTGNAEFGFGEGDEVTAVAAGSVTYYARTTFDLSLPDGGIETLGLKLRADDGAIVYVNGVEAVRDNLPDTPVSYLTGAVNWRGGKDEVFREFSIDGGALVDGTNLVAVEVHNMWAGNNDLSFDLELATTDEPAAQPAGPLVDFESEWLHFDSSAGVAANWATAADKGTASRAQFGFGEGDEETTVAMRRHAYYFTQKFEVDDLGAIADQLNLRLLVDDGAVVYLNGTEVYRFNMPEGIIYATTKPIAWVAGRDEAVKDHPISSSSLVQGTNVIAVEIHNYWPGNNDLSFDLQLE